LDGSQEALEGTYFYNFYIFSNQKYDIHAR